jgi:ribosomal protein S27AE
MFPLTRTYVYDINNDTIVTVKYLKCPECGFIFVAPLTDKKRTGFGFSTPGRRVVDFPNCKT